MKFDLRRSEPDAPAAQLEPAAEVMAACAESDRLARELVAGLLRRREALAALGRSRKALSGLCSKAIGRRAVDRGLADAGLGSLANLESVGNAYKASFAALAEGLLATPTGDEDHAPIE